MTDRSLLGQTALIYGGGGVMGAAIAKALARRGAAVVVAGRTLAKLERVVAELRADGGLAEAAGVDALDGAAVEALTQEVVARRGRLDIVADALGFRHVQGAQLGELSLEDFERPIAAIPRSLFLLARAAAPAMQRQGRGVILTLSVPGAVLTGAGWLGHGAAFAAKEAMVRLLAAELGPAGVRVVAIRPDATPEAMIPGGPFASHAHEGLSQAAAATGRGLDELLEDRARSATMLRRLPRLAEIAETAAFLASSSAGAITGSIVNLTCGSVPG